MNTTPTLLEVIELTKTYGEDLTAVHALKNISLSVKAGEMVSIMGPSGSGKTTLLALAGGLEEPTSGRIFVSGAPVHMMPLEEKAKLRRQKVGYIFQDYNLVPTLTVLENVALPAELDGVDPKTAQTQAAQVLEEIGIGEIANRFVDQISGGQAQRVAIARAMTGEKKLILADEPTGALDTVTGEGILNMLRSRADAGAAVMLVTHEARYAAWADRVVYLRDGEIIDSPQAGVR